jgi:hypothetical protein
MPNNDLGEIRRSTTIITAAPGAVVDFRAEGAPISAVITGLDDWDINFPPPGMAHEQVVYEERLQKKLGVTGFRLPPVLTPNWHKGPNTPPPALMAVRFPNWLQCPQCNRLAPAVKWGSEPGRPWRKCPYCFIGYTVHVMPVRFVMACANGHLEEFPWAKWVEHRANGCDGEHGFLKLVAEGPGLAGLVLSCPKCGASKTLDGIFSSKTWTNRITCSGRRPWLGDIDPKKCDLIPRVLQRGASNMHYSCVETALSIPPWSDSLPERIGTFWATLTAIKELDERIRMIKLLGSSAGMDDVLHFLGLTAEMLARKIEERQKYLETSDCNNLRIKEYQQFTDGDSGAHTDDQHFEMRNEDVPAALTDYFDYIVRLVRLREVRALKGFTRIFPPGADSTNIAPISKRKKQWLPAVEVKGEGIFVALNLEQLHAWEMQDFVRLRAESVQKEYVRKCVEQNKDEPVHKIDRVITPRFLLVHTFAHALMRQLSLECGYSSTALRERLYVDGNDMAGVVIYTATSDADGTLGGLQRQGTSLKMAGTVPKAIRAIEWCSSDPLCIEGLMCGTESFCLAACHACVLAPETSCEEFNHFLDRGMLTGWPEYPQGGYFSSLTGITNA